MLFIERMMKIAYILDLFPVVSETFIVREILELQRQGFEVLLYARGCALGRAHNSVVHSQAEALLNDVHYFRSLKNKMVSTQLATYILYFLILNPTKFLMTFLFSVRNGSKTLRDFFRSVLYGMQLQRNGVDHIHAHFALDACKHAMLISMLTGIPYSFTIHAHDIFLPQRADLMEEKFGRAKFVSCISEYNRKYILRKYPAIEPGNLRIVHCGIDLQALTPRPKKKRKRFRILAIGRLVEQKGFKYLIQACHVLSKKSNFDFVCEIIGEGEERSELEQLLSEYRLEESVHLLGALEQTEVINLLNSADLFVLPCVVDKMGTMDGIPVVLMEAMALEIPIISTRVSGVPELVKDGSGTLVGAADVDGLAKAIETMSKLPDNERKEIGRRGRAVIREQFNLTKEVQKLAELIRT
jgi:glycosyltransferase involved in cell wall biosynthesis